MCRPPGFGTVEGMSFIVATDNLTKSYGGHAVVDSVDLRIPEGCVYGFLGPNGSGKSTTMKMLLSLIRPTQGEVHVLGRPMNRGTRRELLAGIGSLIESPPGYAHLSGRENMSILQRMLGLDDRDIAYATDVVRMTGELDKKVSRYSLGMKQRLGIAMALARRPRLLILDEPTNGLDPAGIEEIRELLTGLADEGVTLMVSSHILGEIDKTASMIGILSQGRLIFQGSRDELFTASTPDVLIDTASPALTHSLAQRSGESRLDGEAVRVAGLDDTATARLVADLVGAGVAVHGVRRDVQSLETVFTDLTQGGGL